jgi:hypothetical protein
LTPTAGAAPTAVVAAQTGAGDVVPVREILILFCIKRHARKITLSFLVMEDGAHGNKPVHCESDNFCILFHPELIHYV